MDAADLRGFPSAATVFQIHCPENVFDLNSILLNKEAVCRISGVCYESLVDKWLDDLVIYNAIIM